MRFGRAKARCVFPMLVFPSHALVLLLFSLGAWEETNIGVVGSLMPTTGCLPTFGWSPLPFPGVNGTHKDLEHSVQLQGEGREETATR